MPLGELQENMHLGEGLPISAEYDVGRGRSMLTSLIGPERQLPQCSDLVAIGRTTDIAPTSPKRPD